MKLTNYFLITFSLLLSLNTVLAQAIGDNPFSVRGIVPACENSSSDTDGDGWGWENNETCHVGSSFERVSHPICKSKSADPDGDGWGWENNKTCVVSNTTTGVSSNSNPVNTNNTQNEVVTCKSANSDPDGDGWGWENNASCKVDSSEDSSQNQVSPAETETVTPLPVEPEVTEEEPGTEPARVSTTVIDENCDSSDLRTRVDTLLASPDRIGFGAKTTGGAAARSITWVTNTNDSGAGSLRTAVRQAPPVWIAFDESLRNKTINLKNSLHVNDGNLTIDGRGKNGPLNITLKLDGATHGILMWKGNVILQGIRVDGNNTDATAVMARRGENFWFDHLSVTNMAKDDALSISMNSYENSANYITVSNYHTYNTNKGLLAGGEPNVHGHKRYITILKSQFSAFERNPTIYRGYRGHVYNNYMHSFTWGMHVSCKGIANVENNHISGGSNSLNAGENRYCVGTVDDGIGRAYSNGNIFTDGARQTGPGITSTPVMDIPYSYELMDTDDVKDYVVRNSGAENAVGVCEGY